MVQQPFQNCQLIIQPLHIVSGFIGAGDLAWGLTHVKHMFHYQTLFSPSFLLKKDLP